MVKRIRFWLKLSGLCIGICPVASSGCDEAEPHATQVAAGAGGQTPGSGGSDTLIIVNGGSAGRPSGFGPSLIIVPRVLCGSGEGGAAGDAARGGAGHENGGAAGEPAGAAGQAEAGAAAIPLRDDSCAPPPSVCADELTLVYFSGGTCVDGTCQWSKSTISCSELCSTGGCYISITK